MRICVPLLSSAAGDASSDVLPLAAHFGLAERFAVLDSASGKILDECGVSACHCPLPNLANIEVDALAGQAMGYRLMQISRHAKLSVLAVKAQTLGELRREMRNKSTALPLLAAQCLTNTPRRAVGGKR